MVGTIHQFMRHPRVGPVSGALSARQARDTRDTCHVPRATGRVRSQDGMLLIWQTRPPSMECGDCWLLAGARLLSQLSPRQLPERPATMR